MNIAAIADQKDFALPALLAAVTLAYLFTAALWLGQLMWREKVIASAPLRRNRCAVRRG